MRSIFVSLVFVLSLNVVANWQTLSFSGSNIFVFVPKGVEKTAPLMINLHGCAQKAKVLVDHGNWEEAATEFKTIIAIPEVPGGGVIAGCWDYYGLDHTRSNKHNGFVLKLVEKLKSTFSVDNKKVFVSGLSSGGGLSFVLACLAPDVFTGVGLNAAPSVGTSSAVISRARISKEQIRRNCNTFAGSNRSLLAEQKVSIIYGDNDYLVDRKYSSLNAEAYASILEAGKKTSFDVTKLKGSHSKGKGTFYAHKNKSPVISLIENTGLGHNWPAGQGGSGRSFVSKNSVDYPFYLLSFFLK